MAIPHLMKSADFQQAWGDADGDCKSRTILMNNEQKKVGPIGSDELERKVESEKRQEFVVRGGE